MALGSHEIAMVSNKLSNEWMTSNTHTRRLLYRDGIVPMEEVQYYLQELSNEQDATEIILLLCAAGDLLDNIREKPV